ncbi:hypothetical protein M569_14951 [Genlisea aurea]|uniref:RNA uridylyltransferase n=1 Tax=Genlisea aurea TaxID=192259 RepID=S8C665_9LAMI|nr:hypothetical protein M569_14951 [Genlisea aurea]
MNGGGEEVSFPNGGDFLLQLLRNPPGSKPSRSEQGPSLELAEDPAVAAMGPSVGTFQRPHPATFLSNGSDFGRRHRTQSSSPFNFPNQYFHQSPNVADSSHNDRLGDASRKGNARFGASLEMDKNLVFGSLNRNAVENGSGFVPNRNFHGRNEHGKSVTNENPLNWMSKKSADFIEDIGSSSVYSSDRKQEKVVGTVNRTKHGINSSYREIWQPPVGFREPDHLRPFSGHKTGPIGRSSNYSRIDSPGRSAETRVEYVGTVFTVDNDGGPLKNGDQAELTGDNGMVGVLEDMNDRVVKFLDHEDDTSGGVGETKKHLRDKDYRSDQRGHWIMGQRMRHFKSQNICRSDINAHNAHFTALFDSLIPSEEEKSKQKELLATLESLVVKEWPDARLHLYGSCANSFGFPKSDIDVCLVMKLENEDKAEVLLKLAEILKAENLQNVQALTRARVPIVKLMDPVTGIACDICINNILAVENTKLLRDYARIDVRLRQLAFVVKYWAKKREVNETYQGTLSSYAYVLMCIHFLQQRNPPILPCLQEMRSTYIASAENVECSYFDRVDLLREVGSPNRESLAELVWGFFHYWAYCHDYANAVISVRTGATLSKRVKDWTRRVGNDRHLICIEDPFEVSHDLGRVVDKFSIRVIREEFERAAEIMQNDPRPGVTLFEAYKNPS